MKIYTVEQGGYEEHSILSFYIDKDDAVKHLDKIYETLKICLKDRYDNFKLEYGEEDESLLELEYDKDEHHIRTHFYFYYVEEYESGKIYNSIYDKY